MTDYYFTSYLMGKHNRAGKTGYGEWITFNEIKKGGVKMTNEEIKELEDVIAEEIKDEEYSVSNVTKRVLNWFEGKELHQRFRGKIEAFCESVMDGHRPCAMVPVPEDFSAKALGIVNDCRLQGYLEKLSPGFAKLWIYKRDFMFEVIKHLPDKPTTIYEAWILGKAFNYSDETIERFCKEKL